MPSLSRQAPKLLHTVVGRRHATAEDHVDENGAKKQQSLKTRSALPTPPASNAGVASSFKKPRAVVGDEEEDIYADPKSSDDEAQDERGWRGSSHPLSREVDGSAGFKLPTSRSDLSPKLATFKVSRTASQSSNGKRSADESEQQASSDSDAPIFSSGAAASSSSYQSKRRKTKEDTATTGTKKGGLVNIHVQPQRKTYGAGKTVGYGHKDGKKKTGTSGKTTKGKGAEVAKFKAAKGARRWDEKEEGPAFKLAKSSIEVLDVDEEETASLSPSLSSLSSVPDSPEVEEIQALNLPVATEYRPTVPCAICGQSVERILQQDFEDRYNHGQKLRYKSQQSFCRWHKVYSARQTCRERGYPDDISWGATLDARMKKQHTHLLAVLERRTPSVYRDRLEEQVSNGIKTANQGLRSTGRYSVGYYGPRGERAMTEHILLHLSAPLRRLAVEDKLIAATGVVGGVSGFVQAVLAPEMAVGLVMEDLGVDADRAREVLGESAELGEMINDEVEERVVVVGDE